MRRPAEGGGGSSGMRLLALACMGSLFGCSTYRTLLTRELSVVGQRAGTPIPVRTHGDLVIITQAEWKARRLSFKGIRVRCDSEGNATLTADGHLELRVNGLTDPLRLYPVDDKQIDIDGARVQAQGGGKVVVDPLLGPVYRVVADYWSWDRDGAQWIGFVKDKVLVERDGDFTLTVEVDVDRSRFAASTLQ